MSNQKILSPFVETPLYTADEVRDGEHQLVKTVDQSLYSLMCQAGQALFHSIVTHFPQQSTSTSTWLIVCGRGNNGGDGYQVARLAQQRGIKVEIWQYGKAHTLKGDARRAYLDYLGNELEYPKGQAKGQDQRSSSTRIREDIEISFQEDAQERSFNHAFDLCIDGLLGSGLKGEVKATLHPLIHKLNALSCPRFSIDIPSGLCATTGKCLGVSIRADRTLTLVGRKRGLYTGDARAVCGRVEYADLGWGEALNQLISPSSFLIQETPKKPILTPRNPLAHKGHFGRVVCIGGGRGMGGAIALSALASLRCGSGLIAVLSSPESLSRVNHLPLEIMVDSWDDLQHVHERVKWANVGVLGPGLGQTPWAYEITKHILKIIVEDLHPENSMNQKWVIDADGLNLLSQMWSVKTDEKRHLPSNSPSWILTPHAGEAARLLGWTIEKVEQDRFATLQHLHAKYGGVIILKGAGTLVGNGERIWVIEGGGPAMASGGMGDVLSGILSALLAQGLSLIESALCGVWLHNQAGDLGAKLQGDAGLIASDLIPLVQKMLHE